MGDDTKTNDNQTGDDKPVADQTATPPMGTATPGPVVKPTDSAPVTEPASEPKVEVPATETPVPPLTEDKKPEGGDTGGVPPTQTA